MQCAESLADPVATANKISQPKVRELDQRSTGTGSS